MYIFPALDTFTYDQPNRLVTATVGGSTETYSYDGDGVRFSRQVGTGPVTRYVTDVAAALPVTIDDGTRKYVWGLTLAYAVSGSTVEVYHTDRIGSVRAIADATGSVVATYRTDEFGVPTASTGSSSQPFRFTGEPLDASGLTFLRARYYDPSVGRLLTRDPVFGRTTHPLTLNRYSYVTNNPCTLVDPSGLDPSVHDSGEFLGCNAKEFGFGAGQFAGGLTLEVASAYATIQSAGTLTLWTAVGLFSGMANMWSGAVIMWEACTSGGLFP